MLTESKFHTEIGYRSSQIGYIRLDNPLVTGLNGITQSAFQSLGNRPRGFGYLSAISVSGSTKGFRTCDADTESADVKPLSGNVPEAGIVSEFRNK